tara:strand:- start:38244 stop:38639 length:396 start_codon:yes stop_codon:yes gene_type:complete
MIPGHEKQTHELTDEEFENILPLVVRRLKTKVGKSNSVTNRHVVKVFKRYGFALTEPRFRKIIQHIRINGLIKGVVSYGNGYFVAEKRSDIQTNIESLDKRINAQIVTRDSLKHQMKQMFDQQMVDDDPFN